MILIFQNRFYHGDPHAGNIKVSPKGELIILDFGVCGILMKHMRNKFISHLLAILEGETAFIIRHVKNIGVKIQQEAMDELHGELYLALQDFMTKGANANFSGLLGTI